MLRAARDFDRHGPPLQALIHRSDTSPPSLIDPSVPLRERATAERWSDLLSSYLGGPEGVLLSPVAAEKLSVRELVVREFEKRKNDDKEAQVIL